MNTSPESMSKGRPSKERLAHASKIRKFRETATLTQPGLAKELNVKRGAVAQWESGLREPRVRNYQALAELATRRNLLLFRDFFLSEIKRKTSEGEKRRDEAHAERFLKKIKQQAAEGDEEAKYLLDLSKMKPTAYGKRLVKGLAKQISGLKEWDFLSVLSRFTDEVRHVETIRSGYEVSDRKRLARLREHVHRLPSNQSSIAEQESALQKRVENILANGETREGKPAQILDILREIPKGTMQSLERSSDGRKLADRLRRTLEALEKSAAAGEHGDVPE